ncbi:hypothetical protein [Streptomyces sp. NBC_00474]|uniref:hypothetical protein n=1 Tax=Streptomyces sp. NBC_00474 TaxID=2975754 RepID=UPI0022587A61|nr:hypothetical protein [Streptomyces sp. NBC_00474]MCX5049553.1 hypothetical protein [Streptomyces sp. NBC_00474]
MSRSLRKRLAGALAVATMVGGSLTLAAGEASAAPYPSPACNSPVFSACVKIVNQNVDAYSWRISVTEPNGHRWERCLQGNEPHKTSYWPSVWFSNNDQFSMTAYRGRNCEGWSRTDAWRGDWSLTQDQYHMLVAYGR